MSLANRLKLALKLVDAVLRMKADIEGAVVGQHVESDPVRRVNLFGQVGSLYVVYLVEE